jgi:beta-barrel assembly-enhancing protease
LTCGGFSTQSTAALAAACGSAAAQFPFSLPSLPGLGKSTDSGGGLNLNSLVGKATNAVNAFKEVGEPEEIGIGQQFAATLLGAKPLVNDARLQRYVNTLGRWLALQTERPDLPWTFGVLDDAGFNAFATPGGYVFVTRGLVERMCSEAELAGVLAHEIAHVLKKHHLAAVQKNARVALGADVFSAVNKDAGGEARALALGVIRDMIAKGLDQGDEFEADRLGVVIAARAGYDAYGLPSVLQLLQAQSAQDGVLAAVQDPSAGSGAARPARPRHEGSFRQSAGLGRKAVAGAPERVCKMSPHRKRRRTLKGRQDADATF